MQNRFSTLLASCIQESSSRCRRLSSSSVCVCVCVRDLVREKRRPKRPAYEDMPRRQQEREKNRQKDGSRDNQVAIMDEHNDKNDDNIREVDTTIGVGNFTAVCHLASFVQYLEKIRHAQHAALLVSFS